jgi:hypothetical protein
MSMYLDDNILIDKEIAKINHDVVKQLTKLFGQITKKKN